MRGPSGMFPAHVMKALGDPSEIPESDWCKDPDVTGGPFKLQAAVPGQFVEFVANDDYWFGRPKIDRLITPVINSPDATLIALLRGDLDMPWRSPTEADAINDLLKDPRFNAVGVTGVGTIGVTGRVRRLGGRRPPKGPEDPGGLHSCPRP